MAKFRKTLAALLAVAFMGTGFMTACDDGETSSAPEVHEPTITYSVKDGAIYCLVDGVIATNQAVGDYHFDADGKLQVVDEFVEIEGDIYYVKNGEVQTGFQIAYGRVCYLGTDGRLQYDVEVSGYVIGPGGYLVAEEPTSIQINGLWYMVADGYVDGEGVEMNPTPDPEPDPEPNPDPDPDSTSATLTGKLTIADLDLNYSNNAPLANATISLQGLSLLFSGSTTSDEDGNYTFTNLPAGSYGLTIECEGYVTITQIVNIVANQVTVQNSVIEAIYTGGDNVEVEAGVAAGTVIDAFTGQPIEARLTVNIRKGINNTTGDIVKTVETDEKGYYETGDLEPGNYTGEVVDNRDLADEADRFGSIVIAIKIMPGETVAAPDAVISNTHQVQTGSMRIVLTWGEYPYDLDSHLYANEADGDMYHVYYSNQNASSNANLDVDDTSSYGPETITITEMSGEYTYYVHDYTNGSSNGSSEYSTELAASGATVNVYLGSGSMPAYTFYVPNGVGTSWHVFTYNADTGEFTFPNTMEDIYHPSTTASDIFGN